MLYDFELGHNAMDAIKIFVVKKVKVQLVSVGFKKLNDLVRSGRPKTVDSKVMLWVKEGK